MTTPSLSHRLQPDQEEAGPLPQDSWALDGCSGPLGGPEESFSCVGEYHGVKTSSWGGEVPD